MTDVGSAASTSAWTKLSQWAAENPDTFGAGEPKLKVEPSSQKKPQLDEVGLMLTLLRSYGVPRELVS